jgi:hypothetical protein
VRQLMGDGICEILHRRIKNHAPLVTVLEARANPPDQRELCPKFFRQAVF